jgi:hypothetical protein
MPSNALDAPVPTLSTTRAYVPVDSCTVVVEYVVVASLMATTSAT